MKVLDNVKTSGRKTLWLILRIAFVLITFVLIFRLADLDISTLLAEVGTVKVQYVVFALAIWLVALVIVSFRWKVLLTVVRRGVHVGTLFLFSLIGAFYAQFVPGSVTGDIIKGYYLARDGEEKVKVTLSAFVDRVVGIIVNGLLGIGALALSPDLAESLGLPPRLLMIIVMIIIVGIFVGFGVIGLVSRIEDRFPSWLLSVYLPIKTYSQHPTLLLGAAGISIVYFLVWSLTIWSFALAVGLESFNYVQALLILAVVNVAQVIPLTPNGLGLREGILIFLLGYWGVAEERALVFSLLIPFTQLLIALVGGILVLVDYRPQETLGVN